MMQELAVSAAFLSNQAGEVCISLSDPAYVHADSIVVDPDTRRIFAVLHESSHYLGSVSEAMVDAFIQSNRVLLSSLRPDGSVFELTAPVMARAKNGN